MERNYMTSTDLMTNWISIFFYVVSAVAAIIGLVKTLGSTNKRSIETNKRVRKAGQIRDDRRKALGVAEKVSDPMERANMISAAECVAVDACGDEKGLYEWVKDPGVQAGMHGPWYQLADSVSGATCVFVSILAAVVGGVLAPIVQLFAN
ncbi:hypothetical protein [Arthrobacter psychrochitiniphilus]|uniref:hypothetical protein n=1 Tax=Arthrobacter psychrochitiniphilus TaxID=291045 RepID=UPI003F7C6DEA